LLCLSKKPEDRYADAGEFYDAFEECSYAGTWGQREAREWWAQWREQHPEAEKEADTASTLPSGYGCAVAVFTGGVYQFGEDQARS